MIVPVESGQIARALAGVNYDIRVVTCPLGQHLPGVAECYNDNEVGGMALTATAAF